MSLSLFSTWSIGILNGYTLKENGLPNSIKYGTMVLASGIHIVKDLGNFTKPIPKTTMVGVFVAIPIMIGATFCVGNYLGKGVRYAKDSQ